MQAFIEIYSLRVTTSKMGAIKIYYIASLLILVTLDVNAGIIRPETSFKFVPPVVSADTRESSCDGKPAYTFDDLYDSQFSYSTFSPQWVSDSEHVYRDNEGIKKDDFNTGTSTIIVPNEFYTATGASGWSLSNDEKYLLARVGYKKQWRHSYNASYTVYDISDLETNPNPVDNVMLELDGSTQYARWSPTSHTLLWIVENDIYINEIGSGLETKRLTNDGEKNALYNGVPDWVYEEEMVSSTNTIYWSPDSRYIAFLKTYERSVPHIQFSTYFGRQYPKMMDVAYPKAGTINPVVEINIYDVMDESIAVVTKPVEFAGKEYLFARFNWFGNSRTFLVSWLNRISNVAVAQWAENDYGNVWLYKSLQEGSESSSTGWIGNGGRPFNPLDLNDNSTNSYATAFSSEGYWQIAVVNPTDDTKRWITTGTLVVTSLYAFDELTGHIYFQAAAPTPDKRHIYRVDINVPDAADYSQWECMSCDLDQERCQYQTASFSDNLSYLVLRCYGPDVPMTYMKNRTLGEDFGEGVVMENNDHLIANKETVKWPVKTTGTYHSDATGIDFLYEMYIPCDFDENKNYPLLIEVYGGPGYQKVRSLWTNRWAQTHMVSQYDMIVASLDARGSGYRGDAIAHMTYKKLGQYEKLDTTEMTRHFTSFSYIDADNVAIWGWSYGGYTTTHTISEGSDVFKCGMAVAPLASRFYYDSIHTERYMDMPEDNVDGYEKCSILNTNLENFKKADYTIIHGTADDNVHFQNAALISKALVEAGVVFDNFFYADEAHSVNTAPNANQHIYKYLTSKVRSCFGLAAPQSEEMDADKVDFSKFSLEEYYQWYSRKYKYRRGRAFPEFKRHSDFERIGFQ